MSNLPGENLRRLLARNGLTIDELASRSGVDVRSIRGILEGTQRAQSRTLHRLAAGLGCSTDELFLPPAALVARQFDRETNPCVTEVIEAQPELFDDWTEADFHELYSRFGAGGALTSEGVLAVAAQMNRNRGIHEKLAALLESSQAEAIAGIVELLYAQSFTDRDNSQASQSSCRPDSRRR